MYPLHRFDGFAADDAGLARALPAAPFARNLVTTRYERDLDKPDTNKLQTGVI